LLTGAHTSMHDFTMHGLRWKAAPFSANSGYRNSQFIVLSEHFEMLFDLPQAATPVGAQAAADYIYNPTASYEGLTNGIWGLLRSYPGSRRCAHPRRPPRPQRQRLHLRQPPRPRPRCRCVRPLACPPIAVARSRASASSRCTR
jgi:hypothetical protein